MYIINHEIEISCLVKNESIKAPSGYLISQFYLITETNILDVIKKARSVLLMLAETSEAEWDEFIFPDWFMSSFSPALTEEENEQYLNLPYEIKAKYDRWDRLGWLYWREKDNRQWLWAGYEIVGENEAIVKILNLDDVFISKDLEFLLKTSGANEVMAMS